ncbi:hypothetical protein LDENG_00001350 [Lucifuga dentata]|nr:hypothetical protein LDENG_00001350 [Lucifuga dentata]
MILLSAAKTKYLHFFLYVSIGLLNLPLFTECDNIRLVGPTRCSGRVEVFYRDMWGTVCDDHWSITNADVVCRELKCGTVLEAKHAAFFGEGKNTIWLDDVQCTGHESSLLKCQHKAYGENNCGHSEDAGVVCSDSARLINGTNRCIGRVEIYHENNWRKVCNSDWSHEAAQVLCKEIRCGSPVTPAEVLNFGEGSGMIGVKTTCFGNESSLAHCSLQEFSGNCGDAVVFCGNSKPIRLVNGSHQCSGRVEVFHDGQWGTVCDDRWGMQEADVTCREMNCGSATSVKYASFYGRGQDRVWLDDIECTGHEKSIGECSHRGFGVHDCSHNEDAGVECSETIKLVNGTDRCSGRLEVYHNNQWVKICENNWNTKESAIVCKELNCGTPANNVKPHFGKSTGLRGYTASCSGNEGSISQCSIQVNPASCEDVSVSCTGNPLLRLVNGTDRCSGRVEINHDGQWGTVCDDEWDIRDAQVVCRAMDCGTAQAAPRGAFFGQSEGQIWLDDVDCTGNETSLLHCGRQPFGDNNCGHPEDAGVICSNYIKLINGTNQCSGRVQIYHNGQWSPVYNVGWGKNEAEVVCREMNCGDPIMSSQSFGEGSEMTGYKISCNGRENSITSCTMTAFVKTSHDLTGEATVTCSGNVRLADGQNHCAGRVEVYNKGQWGTVCGDSWDLVDAKVVCKELNCGNVHIITNSDIYGLGTGKIWINRIDCAGSDSTLSQCSQREFGERPCNSTSVAGVLCSDGLEVRLVNSNTHDPCSGRVEVRHGEEWGTVCSKDWSMNKSEVVCQLLGCGHAVSAPGGAHFGQGSGPIQQATDSCFGNLTSLQQCSIQGFSTATCSHEEDAGVVCAAQIRLVSGLSQCSGRVEVFHGGQWGTVCDDEWELPSAQVVCKQLGCGRAVVAPGSAHFGRGTGPIWLDNVECTGEEAALTQCPHAGLGQNNCGHGEDAGVVCLGGLPKPQITLSPATEINWGDKVDITCSVVSEHLGGTFILKKSQDSFKMEKFSITEAVTFTIPKVEFSHKGSYYCEYQKKFPNQNVEFPPGDLAELSVTVSLEKPSISLTSPYVTVIFSPDKIEVTKGNRFSITCSIHSRYSGGFFYLTMSNMNITEPKPAFGHSVFYMAYFEFPEVDYKHQGKYSCVYCLNISSMIFSSPPSKSLQVTVVASSNSSAVTSAVIGILVLLLLVLVAFLVWRKRRQGVAAMVRFSNRLAEATKSTEDKGNGALDGRDYNVQANEQRSAHGLEERDADVDPGNPERNAPEDLTGRVCYELEPLILTS